MTQRRRAAAAADRVPLGRYDWSGSDQQALQQTPSIARRRSAAASAATGSSGAPAAGSGTPAGTSHSGYAPSVAAFSSISAQQHAFAHSTFAGAIHSGPTWFSPWYPAAWHHPGATASFLHFKKKSSGFSLFISLGKPVVWKPVYAVPYKPWWYSSFWYWYPPSYYTFHPLWRPGYYVPVYWHKPVFHHRVVYKPVHRIVTVQQAALAAAPVCPYTHEEAWEHLAAGRASLALDAFACLSATYPRDALAHVGAALANGTTGSLDSAAVMMRQAARLDADSLRRVPADEGIDAIVLAMLDHATAEAQAPRPRVRGPGAGPGDAMFMIAALRTILHLDADAYFAAVTAIEQGDRDSSTIALKQMLERVLSEGLYSMK